MKNFKYISDMKTRIIFLFCMLVILAACTKNWLDINKDPNNPTSAPLKQLLTNVEVSLADNEALAWEGLSEFLAVYMQQYSSREEMDQYGLTGESNYVTIPWTGMYAGPLEDLELMIKTGTENGDMVYVGIAKILKAYAYSVMVDIYGDIPFSEANKMEEGITYPHWDNDEIIYPALFALINEGIADINDATAENMFLPGTDDLIYGGDTQKWIKAANTIKLMMYNQIRLYQDVTAEVNALINEGNLISSNSENFALPYGTSKNPDNRHPGFNEYEVGQKGHYISPWFYEILKGYNPNRFTGISDPRVPYYFYNQLLPGQPTREGNPTEYRDGGFVSIYFGSIGINRDHSTDGSMTVLGIYPVGGRYDEGDAIAVDGLSGTGAIPHRFLTYADRLFIEAELIHAGLITGDARAKLQAGIEESMSLVDWAISFSETGQTIPTLAGSDTATYYVNAVMAEYDGETSDGQLEIILTEKWISSFGNSIHQYSDYRRTGYPVIWDPNNPVMAPGGYVTPPEGNPVPVQCTNPFQISIPWSADDLNINMNAPPQKNAATYNVFWDVN
jgi:hypothetical protein